MLLFVGLGLFGFGNDMLDCNDAFPCLFKAIGVFGGVVLYFDLHSEFKANLNRLSQFHNNQKASNKETRPFFLFLRSFHETHSYRDYSVAHYNVVEELDVAARKLESILVAIGSDLPLPPNHGVFLINCDDANWWKNFEVLADHAKAIIVSPEITNSILDEVSYITGNGLLAKMVVVMNPAPSALMGGEFPIRQNDAARKERWERAVDIYREHGIMLPRYEDNGRLIGFNPDGSVYKEVELAGDIDAINLSTALYSIISPRKNSASSLQDVTSLLSCDATLNERTWILRGIPGDDKQFSGKLGLYLVLCSALVHVVGSYSLLHVKGSFSAMSQPPRARLVLVADGFDFRRRGVLLSHERFP